MSVRCGRPGMPPSPNQSIVYGALFGLERRLGLAGSGEVVRTACTIDEVHAALVRSGPRQGNGAPWSRSTVRDHLNDLVLKGHVGKTISSGTGFYLTQRFS